MKTPFRPMLAGKAELPNLRYPIHATPKLDGIRCLAMGGRAMSRTMKPLPNKRLQAWFSTHAARLEGLDGELLVGPPNAPDCYRRTVSGIMSESGEPDFTYWVFDRWEEGGKSFALRWTLLPWKDDLPRLNFLPSVMCEKETSLLTYEEHLLTQGYEGVMLRDLRAPYKQGRSTGKEGFLLKLKRFEDAEAEVAGVEELYHNDNPLLKDERGYSKRSSHEQGMTPSGTMGALRCQIISGEWAGVITSIGSGFTAQERKAIWASPDGYIGRVLKFKYLPMGGKDKPRHPIFLGWRGQEDR